MAGTEVHGIGNFKKHLGGAAHGKGVLLYLQARSTYQREQRKICDKLLSDLTQSGHGTLIFGIRVKAGDITSGHALECSVCSKRDAQLGEVAFPFTASARTDNILAHCNSKNHRSRVARLSTTAPTISSSKLPRGRARAISKGKTLPLQTNSISSYYAKGKGAIDDEGKTNTKKANGDGDEEGGKKTRRANSDRDEEGGKNKKQKKQKIKKKQKPEETGTAAPNGEDRRDPDGSSPGAGDAVPDGGTGGPSAGDAGAGNTGRGESQRNEGGGGKDDGAGDAGERKEGGDAGDADGGASKQMQIRMDALDSLGDSALEGTLLGLGKHKSRAVTPIAGVPGGACAGFWFRSFYARKSEKGRRDLAACGGQGRLVVYDEAYEHTASTFIGKSADAHVVTLVRRGGDVTVRGTFRSAGKHMCAQFSKPKETFQNGMCTSCARLEHSKPLQQWVQKNMAQHAEAEGETEHMADPSCNNQYLTTFEREQKMATIASSLRAAHRRGDCLENEVAALKSTPVDVVKELMTHHAKDSIEVAVCAKLLVAQKKNLITPEHKNLLSIMKDQCKNMTRKPAGFRHGDASKTMSSVLSVTYGQNCPKWLTKNVCGPSSRTIGRHLPQAKFKGGYEDTVQIVTQAKSMYQRLMKEHDLKPGSVACYLAEDETSIQAEASYNQGADAIVGFCGKIENDDGKAHECTLDGHCYIGCGGHEAYERILEAMTTSMVGNNGRCIMFVPLHRKLPAMVVLLATTCNRFSAEGYVGPQWTAVSRICNEVLGDVVGHVIGHASDGDGRRRHLMTKIGSPGMARETQAEILVAVHARADRMEPATACLRFEPTTGCAG
jgi:hypothetical protein